MPNKRVISMALIAVGCMLLLCAMGLTSYNLYLQNAAEKAAEELKAEFDDAVEQSLPVEKIIDEQPREGEMPVRQIGGYSVCAELSYPRLGIGLPVIEDWSYEKLKISACRYSGTIEDGGLIIMAHNFATHFGKLKLAEIGDEVQLKDTYGDVYSYTVVKKEEINGYDLDSLMSGDYDLSLFTCNYSGKFRIVVRLNRADMLYRENIN